MAADSAYEIEVRDQDIIVRLHGDVLDRETITRFLDYLQLETIRRRSHLTEDQAAELAAEIDANVWEKLRSKVEGN